MNVLFQICARAYDPQQPHWQPDLFDAIEVHGVRIVEQEGQTDVCEVDDQHPEFYSVYLHQKTGGVDCVGDFSNYAQAIQYANELSTSHNWPITYIVMEGGNPLS